MTLQTNGNLEKQCEMVEKFLMGERKPEIVCTIKISRILQKKYPIDLYRREAVNSKLGLYKFKIEMKDSS